jgi:hypothetical protein
MRILANENIPRDAVEALQARGHDVAWLRTDAPGSSDPQTSAPAPTFGDAGFARLRRGMPVDPFVERGVFSGQESSDQVSLWNLTPQQRRDGAGASVLGIHKGHQGHEGQLIGWMGGESAG